MYDYHPILAHIRNCYLLSPMFQIGTSKFWFPLSLISSKLTMNRILICFLNVLFILSKVASLSLNVGIVTRLSFLLRGFNHISSAYCGFTLVSFYVRSVYICMAGDANPLSTSFNLSISPT